MKNAERKEICVNNLHKAEVMENIRGVISSTS
jgi:hypothetical protein